MQLHDVALDLGHLVLIAPLLWHKHKTYLDLLDLLLSALQRLGQQLDLGLQLGLLMLQLLELIFEVLALVLELLVVDSQLRSHVALLPDLLLNADQLVFLLDLDLPLHP